MTKADEEAGNVAGLFVLLAIIAWGVFGVWACQQPNQPDRLPPIIINAGNNDGNNDGSGGASPSPTSCPGVATVRLNAVPALVHPTSVQVGFTTFDSTGSPRSRTCDSASTETWTVSPPCVIDRPGAVNPTLSAPSAGSCLLAVQVDTASDSETVTVN